MITPLKKARKESKVSLQDMAYILDMDTSNLSKYERGINYPPMLVLLGYHILTKVPLTKIFKVNLENLYTNLSLKITNLISFLEDEVRTEKISKRLLSLENLLDNISCLKDLSEKDDED